MDLSLFNGTGGAHLLVAGEVGIDEYIWGDTRRISPEAPVPVVEVDSQSYKLGLGANVAQNLSALGAKVSLVSVCGEDADGGQLQSMLDQAGIKERVLISDPSRPTLRKTRVIAQRQHVVRIDYEKSHVLDAKFAKRFTESVCDLIPKCDGVILQDYAKGLWNTDTVSIIQQAKAHKRPVFVDPSRLSSAKLYKGATLLTPNIAEAEQLAGLAPQSSKTAGQDDARLLEIATRILKEADAQHVVVTCGEWGMVSFSKDNAGLRRIPTFARDVFDVTGAGDTVVSVLALMMVLGQPLADCMQIANAAAGIVVGRIGASTVTAKELQDELARLEQAGLLRK